MERATLRRTDKRTGQIYHLKYNPPPPDAELEHRADDREETVEKRLDAYEAMTAALLPHYESSAFCAASTESGTRAEVTGADALLPIRAETEEQTNGGISNEGRN